MKPGRNRKGKYVKDLDVYLTQKTGANRAERDEWRDATNRELELMREAQKDGREEDAKRHGSEANRLFTMGPGGYKRMKERQAQEGKS